MSQESFLDLGSCTTKITSNQSTFKVAFSSLNFTLIDALLFIFAITRSVPEALKVFNFICSFWELFVIHFANILKFEISPLLYHGNNPFYRVVSISLFKIFY